MRRILALLVATACSSGPDHIVEVSPPEGPPPLVEPTVSGGLGPVRGSLVFRPQPGTIGWRFEVDVTGDNRPDHEGILERPIAFHYRFDSPGVHVVTANLTGPQGALPREWPIVVSDPSLLRTTRAIQLPIEPDADITGIAATGTSEWIFVSDHRNGLLYRIDATDMHYFGTLELERSLSGLSVTPSDTLLFAIHQSDDISVISVPRWERMSYAWAGTGGHHILAIDDTFAYVTGEFPILGRVNVYTGERVSQIYVNRELFHFDVSPAGDLVAVTFSGFPDPAVVLARPVSLAFVDSIAYPLEEGLFPTHVAFDGEGRLYVSASRSLGRWEPHLQTIDPARGEIVQDLILEPGLGLSFCHGNPTARTRSGRYVAFACRGATIIDTRIGLPVSMLDEPIVAVAPHPSEEKFYFARADGVVEEVEVIEREAGR
jgi:hypothetical protein